MVRYLELHSAKKFTWGHEKTNKNPYKDIQINNKGSNTGQVTTITKL